MRGTNDFIIKYVRIALIRTSIAVAHLSTRTAFRYVYHASLGGRQPFTYYTLGETPASPSSEPTESVLRVTYTPDPDFENWHASLWEYHGI